MGWSAIAVWGLGMVVDHGISQFERIHYEGAEMGKYSTKLTGKHEATRQVESGVGFRPQDMVLMENVW